jgi:hypothetical protein
MNVGGLVGYLNSASVTLLCQLLAQHPDIHCEGCSSPLCNTQLGIRRMISDDTFFLSQLDTAFDSSYSHLACAMRGFLRGSHEGPAAKIVVDKNRAWLTVQESDSHYHMKYPHTQSGRVASPKRHELPPRIQAQIETAYAWYYQLYYPPTPQ